MQPIDYIEQILTKGTPGQRRLVFEFDNTDTHSEVVKKFKLFAKTQYPRYFSGPKAKFHDDMIVELVESYYGANFLNIAFRGSAKTTLAKLFVAFVILNDKDGFRRYIKILTKDGKNSKQIVTDVYNLIVEVREIYGNIFEDDSDIKREETMSSFTTKLGRKLSAGTVGQTQRGHLQDAYRPDWIWFDDVEDRDSIRSMVITQGVIDKCAEAIDGLSKAGSYMVTANYISDQGTVEWFKQKPSVKTMITPIQDAQGNPTWDFFTKEDVRRIKADADDFYGEYMCDPTRAENKFFDIDRLNEDLKNCKEPKRESSGVKYWAEYLPHHRYGQGSDHSDGVGLDSNALAGFDFTTGELVYTYASNDLEPDLCAHIFARVGMEFGNCIYAPEVNNKCGGIVISTLKEIGYPYLYKQTKQDRLLDKQTDKLGWDTNGSTKRNMFFDFKRDYNDGKIKIYDENVIKEMRAYTNNDLQETNLGLVTRHFDLLTAVVIAWQMEKEASPQMSEGNRIEFTFDKFGRPTLK